jgi:AraC family transcriptional regulator, arabinose operon regulatory protein
MSTGHRRLMSPEIAAQVTERLYYPSKAGFVFSTSDSRSRLQLPFYGLIAVSNDDRPIRAMVGERRIEERAFAVWARDIDFDAPRQGYTTFAVNPLHRLFRAFTKIPAPHVLPLRHAQFEVFRALMDQALVGTLTHQHALQLFNGVFDIARSALPLVTALDERAQLLMQTLWERPRCTLDELASVLNLSYHRASHAFVETVGIPVRTYQLWQKLYRASAPLQAGKSLTEAAHIAGFSDSAHYSRAFQTAYGRSPTQMFRTRHIEIFCRDEFREPAVPASTLARLRATHRPAA